ncbi:MAG TPA: ammonium transporter [Candidatus Acidoferrales bacterium]|nr:ammonium transporter [Candidatus Acidoferrales bacterium]
MIDSGDVAWIITATALVMIMTPAVGFFYGGLVRLKNLVSTIVQCFAIFAVISLVWAIYGYSIALGGHSIGGFIGDLSDFALNNVGYAPNTGYAPNIPELLYFAFQLKFAAITPALIIGAFAERIRFKSLLIFVVLWTTFIYLPVAHWVWAVGGFLRALGVVDFAGGLVVHTTAGVSAVAAALVVGRRRGLEKEFRPSNIPYVILGASILWFGWFGFNAGSALAADNIAVNALVVTNLAAAAGGVSWMLTDWVRKGKPSAVGMCVGAVCALATITPASGYVGPMPAIIIGLAAGLLSNFIAGLRARTTLDDSLDVFACHGAGGMLGTFATGLFASTLINSAGPNGLFYGNPAQLVAQIIGIVVVASYSFAGSFLLLRAINYVSPIRVPVRDEDAGLDISQHGESAYS